MPKPVKNNGKAVKNPLAIGSLSVRGYKSLADEQTVEIRPLTILAGANSSGKSSIMQPLLLMKQTLEAPYDPGALKLDGPHVRFTAAEQLLTRLSSGELSNEVTIRITTQDGSSLCTRIGYDQGAGLGILEVASVSDGDEIVLRPDMNHDDIVRVIPADLEEHREAVNRALKGESLKWAIERAGCQLRLVLTSPRERGARLGGFVYLPGPPFEWPILRIVHLPGLRGNPERMYPITGIAPAFMGEFQHYAASVVLHWQESGDARLRKLVRALRQLGLAWAVEARKVEDTRVELRVGRLPSAGRECAADLVSIADVGYGVSQVLPVVVGLLVADPGQLVYLEQPEIHLHPRAQIALAGLLVEAANRGVRVVAETHSSLLILEVQTLIAVGKIAPEDVKLHWFRRQRNGMTTVRSADVDEAGGFGDWPEDFGDVELTAHSAFITAAERRMGLR